MKNLLKTLVQPFLTVLYRLVLLFSFPIKQNKKYTISICAIFKNESPYLREWIEYHKLIGVEHFYLYNNFSDDDYQIVLKPYIESDEVTLIDFPIKQGQILAYKDCINKYSCDTNWLGFIYLDEFIVPVTEYNLNDFLSKFIKYPSVVLNWKSFGTSGLISRDISKPVIESFTLCQPDYFMGKSFYNTWFSYNPTSRHNQNSMHHFFWGRLLGIDIPPVNANKKLYFSKSMKRLDHSKHLDIQINHYYTKSVEEYKEKIKRGDVLYKDTNYGIDKIVMVDSKSIESDYTIFKYIAVLKMNLEGLKG